MKLYLVRHGDYMMKLDLSGLDILSEQGTNEVTNLANHLKPKNLQVTNILHSGINRARQTAELLAQGFVCQAAPEEYRGLKPDDEVAEIFNDVMRLHENTLLVGHMPFMGRLVSQLITGNEFQNVVNFQTAVMACLSGGGRKWVIDWVLSPEVVG